MSALLLLVLLADVGVSDYTRCADPTADAKALAEVSLAIDRLATATGLGEGDAAPPGPAPALADVVRDLTALRQRPCFRIAAENGRWRTPDSAESLVTWWRAGGDRWLTSYVSGANEIVLPPDFRKTLVLDGHEKHPLAPLLCARGDAACGIETKGWIRRAEEAFRAHAVDNGRLPRERVKEVTLEGNCPQKEYGAWRACLEEKRELRPMLPLGRFRAPSGWLVIRGRRGHYSFCDEVRAYDLSDGSAWIAQSCSGLVLTDGGRVDGAATDAKRGVTARAGTVPVDAIREAAWMTLLAGEVEPRVQAQATHHLLPQGMTPSWPAGFGMQTLGLGSFWMSSAQTQLRWTWFRLGQPQHAGELTWPDSSDAGENHATGLLRLAEDSFREGCPPSSPPRELFAFTSGAKVSGLDASTASVKAAQDTLVDALRSLRPCE